MTSHTPLADRFRLAYAHERDCNRKVLTMLTSVSSTEDARFQQACDLYAHLLAVRSNILFHLTGGQGPYMKRFPKGFSLNDLLPLTEHVENGWGEYFACLDENELLRSYEWTASDNTRNIWTVEGILTHLIGHHCYHRGQI